LNPKLKAILALALLLAVGAPAWAASPSGLPAAAQADMSGKDACVRIRDALRQLAEAERQQALALDLFSKGDSEPDVETRLSILLAKSSQLSHLLRAVRAGPVAGQPPVARCLKLGDKALFEAERLSSQVEQVLFDRGFRPQMSRRSGSNGL
jgi:hypothetical protein